MSRPKKDLLTPLLSKILFFTICNLIVVRHFAFSQNADTLKNPSKNTIFRLALDALKKKSSDSGTESTLLNKKGETPFLPYEGKIIRHIIIKQYGFDKIFTDTTKKINHFGTKLLNRLHKNTKESVIKNNLFIRENTKLNPYKIAENERYLRSLEFMQDARIIVNTLLDNTDSIDIVVITKDLFSLTGEIIDLSRDQFRSKIGDANFLGLGQKIQLATLLSRSRTPHFGYEFMYRKNNISNTFINGTFLHTTINPNLFDGMPDEYSWFVQFEKPLISQYSSFAGSITFKHNQSYNKYSKPDSIFYDYTNDKYDGWLGYNIGTKKNDTEVVKRPKTFLALRYFKTNFLRMPYQVKNQYNIKFNDQEAVLGQFNLFKQHFYQTNYVYGFGITEDIPIGYNMVLTAGRYDQSDLKRTYLGIDINRYKTNTQGTFIQYFIRTSAFINHNQWQDAGILLGASMFSKLFIYHKFKIRHYIKLSYTKQFNRTSFDPLRIDNSFGIRYFSSDSLVGDQRISLRTESFAFLKWKLLGFKFAPFAFAEASLLTPEHEQFVKSNLYPAIGGGLRTRNENLIFETVELRFIYFPRTMQQASPLKLIFSTKIPFRYTPNYVKTPDIIRLNDDTNNTIY